MLNKRLQEILDLKDFKEEARHKFKNTYMIVNGLVQKIVDFDFDREEVITSIENIRVVSLDVWLPEAGLYPYKEKAYIVNKIPHRLWVKSFSFENYVVYETSPKGELVPIRTKEIFSLYTAKKCKFWVSPSNIIFSTIGMVGKVVNKKIICIDDRFIQELIDWNNGD